MAKCNRCGQDILMEGTCSDCSEYKLDNFEQLEEENKTLKDKLSRRNMQIKELKKQLEQLRVEKSSLLLVCPNCGSKDIASVRNVEKNFNR